MDSSGKKNMTPLLSIRELRKDRKSGQNSVYSLVVPVLDVAPGEKLLITGPSGSGKSTLLDLIGMVLQPDSVARFMFTPRAAGRESAFQAPRERSARQDDGPLSFSASQAPVSFDVALAWKKNRLEQLALWRRHVGYVLQTGGLLPFIPVRENILMPRKLLGLPKTGLPEMLSQELGISHLATKLPAELSVGERQRIAIARALAAEPPLVLADEPTAALDPANATTVLRLFAQLTDETGTAVILVSHAPEQAQGLGFRTMQVSLPVMAQDSGTVAVLSEPGGVFARQTDGERIMEGMP